MTVGSGIAVVAIWLAVAFVAFASPNHLVAVAIAAVFATAAVAK